MQYDIEKVDCFNNTEYKYENYNLINFFCKLWMENYKSQDFILLIYNFIGTTTTGKGFRLGFKGKAHSHNITHCFF